jgi:cysteine-rich repeat protein
MRHPRLVVPLVAALALVALADSAHALDARDLIGCQRRLEREAAKLTKTRALLVGHCVEHLLACRLRNEIDGAPLAPCAGDATADCSAAFAAAAAAETAFGAKVAAKCAVPDLDFRSRRGLGFRDDGDACAALAPPGSVATTADGLACARRAAACAADDRVEQQEPRAYELLSAAGLAASAPCIDVRAAAPGGAATATSGDLLGCQTTIDKESMKVAKVRERAIRTCTGLLLACDLPADRVEATLTARDACRAAATGTCGARRAKIAQHEATRDARVLAACGGLPATDVKARLGFGLTCAGATTVADVGVCLAADLATRSERAVGTVTPRACPLLRAAGELTDYEDTCVPSCGNGIVEGTEQCDDGNADPTDQCTNACVLGPVDFATVLIPSTAVPANTPDGTPANAVPPGSTLATQFGATIFDLNRASYTRYFAPAAGAPDAVLVLVPGFAAGANAFKIFAENLIVRAQAAGQIRLEVWAFDRRTNLLEDAAGAELAEPTLDAHLALDWFFGAETGLALDPRLTRRALFHAAADVAFIANFTPQVFTRDIDAVIEAARALPSAPAVFLGGHSLGTSFTGRYAATDLDPGAPIVPGFGKLAGLVLLEGAGGSTSVAAPSSADLDRVIAKADGGLYHAVRDGAARCVDGTPCTVDADCSAAPLPAGAVTNKCVATVDAYTGSNPVGFAFINPQIQAAGDIAGIQGVLDPDGLIAIQQDFGGGRASQNVSALGILRALPPASAEAGVGFFLDDDFSPVAAFRASFGFSDDGFNPVILGIVAPGPAFDDPYRRWIDFDQPQPAAAIPNNGAATADPTHVWGQEKEVSSLPRFFPNLFAGAVDFGDWYFASSGLSVTSELNGTSTFGGLDSTALSVGRNRPDIENLTQAAAIDVPVIAFGGSNGLTTTAAAYKPFAASIGTCTAPTCSGVTPRVVVDDPIAPTFGGVGGGFEVYIQQGYAHVDLLTAEDDPSHNNVLGPLLAFLTRNTP